MNTSEWDAIIRKVWKRDHVSFYLAQILSGECTIDETKEDLLSLQYKSDEESIGEKK